MKLLYLFKDRCEAGRILAKKLRHYADRSDVVVLGLPRGGVPVAFEVAQALHAPLDIFLVRKLGVPGQEELAMGAIASGGIRVLNDEVVKYLSISSETIEAATLKQEMELSRREEEYRGSRPMSNLRGQTVILVDDGLATGSSMKAVAEAVKQHEPKKIVVAVPVAAPATCEEFKTLVDEVICAETPEPFHAVGQWYQDFSQTTAEEVRDLLDRSARQPA